jgi:serine/threonine protein kinase
VIVGAVGGGPVASCGNSRGWQVPEGSAGTRWSLPGYRIGPVLGQGGFATVYRARQLRLDRDVAIKVLNADLATGHPRPPQRRNDHDQEALLTGAIRPMSGRTPARTACAARTTTV